VLDKYDELAEEGAVQVFEPWDETGGDPIIGVVGELQFDVLKYRLEKEYGVEVRFDRLPYKFARWVGDLEAAEQLKRGTYRTVLRDQYDEPLVLFKTKHTLRRAEQDNPEVEFHDTAPLFK
jgi:peptide chain release factor 3